MTTNTPTVLTLVSPFHGLQIPIENVPDPAFAEKMVGDGVSIDPLEGILRAPCDGEIAHIHPSIHAITIKTINEVEILLHIGLDTVMLKGKGFTSLVAIGDTVKAGDPLIEFDMKTVAANAPHLLTQVIVSTMELVSEIVPAEPREVQVGDPICTITLANNIEQVSVVGGKKVSSQPIPLINPTGLHARPAAVLSKIAKNFSCQIELLLNDKSANAKSITSIMKLNTKHGDRVVVMATGDDADAAIAAIVPEIAAGLGDEGCIPVIDTPQEVIEEPIVEEEQTPNLLKGISASPGITTGKVFQLKEEELTFAEEGSSPEEERKRVQVAVATAKDQLALLQKKLTAQGEEAKAEIFSAHQELLEDPAFFELVESSIEMGKSAEYAWKSGYERQAKELSELNEILAARANDLLDVGGRVLRILLDVPTEAISFPQGSILIAEDLTPSITANLDANIVKGFCTRLGGATSHVAILARALGIPAVVGIDARALSLTDGETIVINGTEGTISLNPEPELITKIEEIQKRVKVRNEREKAAAQKPAITKNGALNIEVVGNVGKPEEALGIPELGGQGVGLLRSEFLFQDRASAPTEDQQYEAYKQVLEAVNKGDRVVIRTLDVGGDKPLPYLPLPKEENPFLGERGVRVSLWKTDIFRTQLRALLRASVHGNLNIMFPMVGFIDEWRDAKAILEEEREKLGVAPVPTGIMIEVPSAAILANQFAPEVDFFSIGTNDLSQYTMAIDRGHPKLAGKADGLHPSVLTLIKMTADAAHKHGKWAGVCGGLAGDPQAVPVLLGLGVDELSVSIPSIPAVKAQIRSLSREECIALADKALSVASSQEVRKISPNPYQDEQL